MKVVIKRADGGVSVMQLAGIAAEAADLAPEHTDTIVGAEIAAWPKAEQDAVVSWRVMEDDAIPQDRTFRGAWRDDTEAPIVDVELAAARDIWRDRLRQARTPKLEELDVAFMRALEQGAKTTDILSAKQALRDVTKLSAIEDAQTPEELKEVWPEVLGARI